MKSASESRTIQFSLLAPFLFSLIHWAITGLASEMGYDLADSEAEQLVVAFVAALPVVANYIRLRFTTSEPIGLNLKVKKNDRR